MILVNRNFGNPALSQAIGDLFKPITEGTNNDWVPNTGALASGSTLVSTQKDLYYTTGGNGTQNAIDANAVLTNYNNYNTNPQNFSIVTEKFLKTLDKVYSKIWNESFVETGIYNPVNLATLYGCFVTKDIKDGTTNFNVFKKFVDRCITAGVLLEEDRLDYKDQISLSDLDKSALSTYIDLPNKLITLTAPNPINVDPDIDARTGAFHYGKKLFLFVTPHQTNESVFKNLNNINFVAGEEPFRNITFINYFAVSGGTGTQTYLLNTNVRRPMAFFKPKTSTSKFGRSLPMATHLIFSLGSPEDKEAAIIAGTPTPDIIVDHTDRISHIDAFTLKIKFDKLQF